MLGDKRLELSDELRAAAAFDLRIDSLLGREELLLLEAGDLGLRPGLELELRERRPAPERERLTQRCRTIFRLHSRGLGDEASKSLEVELAPLDIHDITRRLRLQDVGAELLSELRDEVLERGSGGAGRGLVPERGDQSIGRDHVSSIEEQQCQKGALLLASDGDRGRTVPHFERAEQAEFEHGTVVTPQSGPEQRSLASRWPAVRAGLPRRRTVAAWLPHRTSQRRVRSGAPSSRSLSSRSRSPRRLRTEGGR